MEARFRPSRNRVETSSTVGKMAKSSGRFIITAVIRISTDETSEIARSIEAWNTQQASELEQMLFGQRKRLTDAERTLRTKSTKKALDDQRKALSLPLIEALGPDMDVGIITIGDDTYEVKNSPRKGTEYKRDVMELLIDTLDGLSPDLANKFCDCIVDIPCKTRTFSIKKSKNKTA